MGTHATSGQHAHELNTLLFEAAAMLEVPRSDEDLLKRETEAFEYLVHETDKNLTNDEKGLYLARFVGALDSAFEAQPLAKFPNGHEQQTLWTKLVVQAFLDEEPVITEDEASKINAMQLGWTASVPDILKNVSKKSRSKFLGLNPPEEALAMLETNPSVQPEDWQVDALAAFLPDASHRDACDDSCFEYFSAARDVRQDFWSGLGDRSTAIIASPCMCQMLCKINVESCDYFSYIPSGGECVLGKGKPPRHGRYAKIMGPANCDRGYPTQAPSPAPTTTGNPTQAPSPSPAPTPQPTTECAFDEFEGAWISDAHRYRGELGPYGRYKTAIHRQQHSKCEGRTRTICIGGGQCFEGRVLGHAFYLYDKDNLRDPIARGTIHQHDFSAVNRWGRWQIPDKKPMEISWKGAVHITGETWVKEADALHDWDMRDHYPECNRVMSVVESQGGCASCWAFAAAGAVTGQLCVASRGMFSSLNQYPLHARASAGYITARHHPSDGCGGGWPEGAFDVGMDQGFAPTGGLSGTWGIEPWSDRFPEHGREGCLPYPERFDEKDPLWGSQPGRRRRSDLGGNIGWLPTPDQCVGKARATNQRYPRSLEQDMIYTSWLYKKTDSRYTHAPASPFLDSSPYVRKRAFLEFGALAVGFLVRGSFWGYRSGVWKSLPGEESQGGHAVTAIGYGPDYVLIVNSWHLWGDMCRCKC